MVLTPRFEEHTVAVYTYDVMTGIVTDEAGTEVGEFSGVDEALKVYPDMVLY